MYRVGFGVEYVIFPKLGVILPWEIQDKVAQKRGFPQGSNKNPEWRQKVIVEKCRKRKNNLDRA